MKTRFIFSILIATCVCTGAKAQLYVDISPGYGLNLAALQYGESTYSGGNSGHVQSKKVSLGTGLNFGAGAGYALNEHLGLELGLQYLMNNVNAKNEFGYENTGLYSDRNTYEDSWKTTMLRVIPALRIMTGGEGKVQLYSKFGIVLGLMGKSVQNSKQTEVYTDQVTSSNSYTNVDEDTWEYKGGMGFGMMGSLGMNFMMNEKMSFYFEANVIGQSWAPKTGTLTKSTSNGTDNLPGMTKSQTEVDYVNSYDYSSSPPSSGSPSKSLKDYYPMSCVSLNIGIHITLGGKSE
jgi:hypothetical protein